MREEYLGCHWIACLTETFYFKTHTMSLGYRDFNKFSESNLAVKPARLPSLCMSLHSAAVGNSAP